VRSKPIVLPSLFRDFALGIHDLQRAFVSLRLRRGAALSFLYDLLRVLSQRSDAKKMA
jgi:hypothetical protein